MHKQARSCICSGASGRVRKACFVFPRLWCCRLIMAGSFHSISFVKSSRASIPGHGPRCNQATVFLVVLAGCEVKELDQDVKWTVRGASRTLSPEMMRYAYACLKWCLRFGTPRKQVRQDIIPRTVDDDGHVHGHGMAERDRPYIYGRRMTGDFSVIRLFALNLTWL